MSFAIKLVNKRIPIPTPTYMVDFIRPGQMHMYQMEQLTFLGFDEGTYVCSYSVIIAIPMHFSQFIR